MIGKSIEFEERIEIAQSLINCIKKGKILASKLEGGKKVGYTSIPCFDIKTEYFQGKESNEKKISEIFPKIKEFFDFSEELTNISELKNESITWIGSLDSTLLVPKKDIENKEPKKLGNSKKFFVPKIINFNEEDNLIDLIV